jgi:hexosaminidase
VAARPADWQSFSYVLSNKAMPQLVAEGIQPRVPLPGAIIKDGMLYMQNGISGLQLEYQTHGKTWQVFQSPVSVNSDIQVRAKIPNTQVFSRQQALSVSGQ